MITINSPISWIGGKKALREPIIDRFPAKYEDYTYVEVFAGGAWVFFFKAPSKVEIINDFNSNLVNLYGCIRDKPDDLIDALTPALNSREEFERIRLIMKNPVGLTDIERAAYYYQQIKFSYGSGIDSYGGRPCSIWANFPVMRQAGARLQRVVIEHGDFERIILRFDSENTFFYADPPYVDTEDYYNDVSFGKTDHKRLADIAHSIKGKILISYNACEEAYLLYNDSMFHIEEIDRLNNMAQRYSPGAMYHEYLISNYDTSEQARQCAQMTLWGMYDDYEKYLSERKFIWTPEKKIIIP